MDLFHIIEDGVAILRSRGRFKQVKIFSRGGSIYAEISKGTFIRLLGAGQTSDPYVSYLDVSGPGVGLTSTGVPQAGGLLPERRAA